MGDTTTARPRSEEMGAAFAVWLDAIRWVSALLLCALT